MALLPVALCWLIAERASWHPRTRPGPAESVFQVAFSPGGKYLAVAAQNPNRLFLPGGVYPSGNRKFDDAVHVWDARGQALLHTLRLPGQSLGSIAFSPDGQRLAALTSWGHNDPEYRGRNYVKVWDVSTGRLQRTMLVKGEFAHHLYWTGNVLTFSSRAGVQQWDANTGKHLHSLLGDDDPAALSPDGKKLAVAYDSVSVRDVESDRQRTMLGAGEFSLLTFSRDGSLLVGRSEVKNGSAIQVWDVASGAVEQTMRSSTSSRALALSPNSSTLATGDEDNAIRLWDVRSGALLRTLRASPARTLAFSPDGSILASGRGDGTFTLRRVH